MNKICTKCGLEKPIEEFVTKTKSKDGHGSVCKDCHKQQCLDYYYKNKQVIRNNANKYLNKIKDYIDEYKSCGCIMCGEKDPACLDLHHLENKDFTISHEMRNKSFDAIKVEVNKCVVLCSNCHRKVHRYNLNIDKNDRNMELKFKRLSEDAILPIRANKSDAGLDLTATRITQEINECGQLILVYHSDLAVEIPEGYVGLLFPRSSVAKKSLIATNCVGVIDSGYRGEIMSKMRSTTDVVPAIFKPGERFAQLVIVALPEITIAEAAELSDSDRGDNGFGSSDEKLSAVPTEEPAAGVDETPEVAA